MDCFLGHLMHSKSGLEIEKKRDQPSQFFLPVKYNLALSFYFFTCQKWPSLVCCRNECFHDRDDENHKTMVNLICTVTNLVVNCASSIPYRSRIFDAEVENTK